MKRDMTLIQAILTHTENICYGNWCEPPTFPNYSDRQVHYHVSLCQQAGYLEAQKTTGADAPYHRFVLRNLTWSGHEALERLRGC